MRDMKRSAEISDCGKYRWWLQRRWADGPLVCFVMLNPSTADAEKDDPTIRRCVSYAKMWGFGALSVRNLFPFRTPSPKVLGKAMNQGIDCRGGERGLGELTVCRTAGLVIAGWGAFQASSRVTQFLDAIAGTPVYCLNKNADGSPVHPLYQKTNLFPIRFRAKESDSWCEFHRRAGIECPRCQFCGRESQSSLWIMDACPCCERHYDPIIAQDEESD